MIQIQRSSKIVEGQQTTRPVHMWRWQWRWPGAVATMGRAIPLGALAHVACPSSTRVRMSEGEVAMDLEFPALTACNDRCAGFCTGFGALRRRAVVFTCTSLQSSPGGELKAATTPTLPGAQRRVPLHRPGAAIASRTLAGRGARHAPRHRKARPRRAESEPASWPRTWCVRPVSNSTTTSQHARPSCSNGVAEMMSSTHRRAPSLPCPTGSKRCGAAGCRRWRCSARPIGGGELPRHSARYHLRHRGERGRSRRRPMPSRRCCSRALAPRELAR